MVIFNITLFDLQLLYVGNKKQYVKKEKKEVLRTPTKNKKNIFEYWQSSFLLILIRLNNNNDRYSIKICLLLAEHLQDGPTTNTRFNHYFLIFLILNGLHNATQSSK